MADDTPEPDDNLPYTIGFLDTFLLVVIHGRTANCQIPDFNLLDLPF